MNTMVALAVLAIFAPWAEWSMVRAILVRAAIDESCAVSEWFTTDESSAMEIVITLSAGKAWSA